MLRIIGTVEVCSTQVRFGTKDFNQKGGLQGHVVTVWVRVTVYLKIIHGQIMIKWIEKQLNRVRIVAFLSPERKL